MIIVADTSPLNYLIQIECDHLLQQLYSKIVVPSAALLELSHAGAPSAVRQWLSRVPAWIEVLVPASPLDASLAYLGLGEREAIQLAQEQHADLLLIDERKGRLEAKRRGLSTAGTLGVLLSAAEQKLVDPETAYRRLVDQTTFRTSHELGDSILHACSVPFKIRPTEPFIN